MCWLLAKLTAAVDRVDARVAATLGRASRRRLYRTTLPSVPSCGAAWPR
jgi:hypothetical protein